MFAIPVQVATLAGNCLIGGLSYYFGRANKEEPASLEEEAQLVDSASLDPFPEVPLYENSRITVRKTMDALCELQSFHPEISDEAMDDICSLLREALLPGKNSLDRSWPAKLTRGLVKNKRECREVNGRTREGKDDQEEQATVAPTLGDVSFDDYMHRLMLEISRDDEEKRSRKEEAKSLITQMEMGAMGDKVHDLVKENESLKAFMEVGLVDLCESISITADATLSAVDMSFKKMNGRLNYCKAILSKPKRPARRTSSSQPSEEEERLRKKLEAARGTIKTLRRRLKMQEGPDRRAKRGEEANGKCGSILELEPSRVSAVDSLDALGAPVLKIQRSNTEMPEAHVSSFTKESGGYCSDDGAGETPLIRSLPAVRRNSLQIAQPQEAGPLDVDSPVQGSATATLVLGGEL